MNRRSVLFVALLFCLACRRDAKPTSAAVGPADESTQHDGGTLIRTLDADVVTINPTLSASLNDWYIVDYVFSPLIYLDRHLEPVPGLAESWDVLDGGRLYRFRLNRKATFSDGRPVRAQDVLFTLRKIMDPASEAAGVIGGFEYLDLARTRATDDHTIEVAFRQPLAAQLLRFSDVFVVPEHVYSKGDFRRDHNSTAVGSGPYRVVRRDVGKQIVLQRRDDYWREKPPLETVIFKVITDRSTSWNALKRGEVDEARVTSETWQREHTNAHLAKTIDFRRFYSSNTTVIVWNLQHPQLADRRVRIALAMCVPLEAVVQQLYHGTARAVSGPFTPDDDAYNPTVPAMRYDPPKAKELLAAAGWRDSDGDRIVDRNGKPLSLELVIMSGNAGIAQFGQMLQAEMKNVGVRLDLAVVDFTAAIQRIAEGNYEAAYFGLEFDHDSDRFSILHSSQAPPRGQNFARYSNPTVDRLLVEARSEMDRSRRKHLQWKIHEIVAADQPYTFTIQASSKWGINRRVRGVAESGGYGLFRWYPGPLAWWIPRDMRTHDRPGQ